MRGKNRRQRKCFEFLVDGSDGSGRVEKHAIIRTQIPVFVCSVSIH